MKPASSWWWNQTKKDGIPSTECKPIFNYIQRVFTLTLAYAHACLWSCNRKGLLKKCNLIYEQIGRGGSGGVASSQVWKHIWLSVRRAKLLGVSLHVSLYTPIRRGLPSIFIKNKKIYFCLSVIWGVECFMSATVPGHSGHPGTDLMKAFCMSTRWNWILPTYCFLSQSLSSYNIFTHKSEQFK